MDLSTPVDVEDTSMDGVRTLTALDRCERCGAQAYVTTMHGEIEMLWCVHHYAEHEDKLAPLKVVDERKKITA